MKIYWKVTMQISATEFKDITVPADSIKDAWAIAMSEVNGVVIAINLLANQQDKIQSLLKPALAAPDHAAGDYDPDCPACLRGRDHTISEHEQALKRNYAASN